MKGDVLPYRGPEDRSPVELGLWWASLIAAACALAMAAAMFVVAQDRALWLLWLGAVAFGLVGTLTAGPCAVKYPQRRRLYVVLAVVSLMICVVTLLCGGVYMGSRLAGL